MGHFYTNVTVKGRDQTTVARAIARMRRVAGVSPTVNGMTVVFDRESEKQDGSACPFVEALTRELDCLALYVTNHDDSVLYYRLYKSGEVIDNYDSCPNYFEGSSVPPEGGNAEVLCGAFEVPEARNQVDDILRYFTLAEENESAGRYVWEIDRHRELAEALGIPSFAVGSGYAYLTQEEWPVGLSPENTVSVTGDQADFS